MSEHEQALIDGFTKKYGIKRLVYYEMHASMLEAIAREKRLKRWNRTWKYRLIEQMNPEWRNLFHPLSGEIAFGPAEIDRLFNDPVGEPESTPPADVIPAQTGIRANSM